MPQQCPRQPGDPRRAPHPCSRAWPGHRAARRGAVCRSRRGV